jgi:PAS domain S-box-containing protein
MEKDVSITEREASPSGRGRMEAWLRAFRELSLNPRAEVVTLLSDWVSVMVQGLGYEVAGAFECDFKEGTLFPWLGQPLPADEETKLMDTGPFILGSPICQPVSYFSQEVAIEPSARDFLMRHPSGSWHAGAPGETSILSTLARALRLERFLWIVHFSRSGIRHADILLVSGFPNQDGAQPCQQDEREFASLGRHVGSLVDNAGLVAELDQERTSLRQANERLDGARNQLVQIFRALPGALLLADAKHIVRSVNEAATKLVGCSEEMLVGTSILDLFERPEEMTVERLAARGAILRTETACKTKNGARVPVLLSATLLPDSSGSGNQSAGMVCIALDIGERKKLEIELRQAQKLESVGRLAAGIAHEINTPVQFVGDSVHFVNGSMDGLAQLMASYRNLRLAVQSGKPAIEEANGAEQVERDSDIDYFLHDGPEALKRAIEGLERVASIVRAMKEFAHPDRKEMAPADINRCVQSTLTVARNEYKYVADLVTDLAEIPLVVCLAGEINQVILNIVVNAAHAIGDKVKGTDQRGCITVRTRAERDAVVVSISDDGGGIPDAIRDRVYDPFFTTKEVGRGTGQGLAIARSVVTEKHGGELWFESETGKGTSFFIRLPIAGKQGHG